jgi:hypothetical protein
MVSRTFSCASSSLQHFDQYVIYRLNRMLQRNCNKLQRNCNKLQHNIIKLQHNIIKLQHNCIKLQHNLLDLSFAKPGGINGAKQTDNNTQLRRKTFRLMSSGMAHFVLCSKIKPNETKHQTDSIVAESMHIYA